MAFLFNELAANIWGPPMGWLSLITIAVALAMDAFAVAVVSGITLNLITRRHVFRLSFHFGLFQAMMTTIGWAAGTFVQWYIAALDHWIAFALLALVGANIIYGALRANEDQDRTPPDLTSGRNLVMVSVATSIDALAVGLSLGVIGTAITVPALVIGITAALLTLLGIALGRRIGTAWGSWIEVLGGVVLIAIGIRVIWQHLM